MCDTKTLAYSPQGYIIRCNKCSRMQLAFGTAAIIINQDDFEHLKKHILLHKSYEYTYQSEPDLKMISVPLTDTVMLHLSYNEFEALIDLVSQACTLIEAYSILDSYDYGN